MYAARLGRRKVEVALAHALLEGHALGLEPVRSAPGGTGEGVFGVHVQHQREVRRDAAAAQDVCLADDPGVQGATRGLVGVGGVVESVAQHHGAAGERGLDDLTDQLGAGRLKEKELALGGHLGVVRIKHERADLLAYGRAARLAQAHDLAADRLDGVAPPPSDCLTHIGYTPYAICAKSAGSIRASKRAGTWPAPW